MMKLRFQALKEERPGERWQRHFAQVWPSYREWFLREGEAARPGYMSCRMALRKHMPELLPLWERLVELAGGGDFEARLLSLYRPTPYLSGCSQAVWTRGEPRLVRNYDYSPDRCEGMILMSRWHEKWVIAQSDSLWGVLDGFNEDGLAVSLAFGGRRVVGDGFGIPLVLRYILEFCSTVREAKKVLERVPSHMAYNISVIDAAGQFATAHVGPDRPTAFRLEPVATNHQREIEWTEHAELTHSVEREEMLEKLLIENHEDFAAFADRFLDEPLFSDGYERGFGTVYTAVYEPKSGRAEYRWPNHTWRQSFDSFDEGEVLIRYSAKEQRQRPHVLPPAKIEADPQELAAGWRGANRLK